MSTYPGGKNASGVVQILINQIPPHHTYIEPFLGGGAVWRYKRPARLQIGLDVDTQTLDDFCKSQGLRRCGKDEVYWIDQGTAIAQECAFQFLANYRWQGGEFVYLDPPYLGSTRRRARGIYRHEMQGAEQHRRLLQIITDLPRRSPQINVAISGYPSSLYAERLADWRLVEFESQTRAGRALECLWCNYPEPIELHDYRYLGTNRTDRQRIKRKTAVWLNRLESLPVLESRALLHAFQQWRDGL